MTKNQTKVATSNASKTDKIRDLVFNLYERPGYVDSSDITIDIKNDMVDIILFEDYHNEVSFKSPVLMWQAPKDGGYSLRDIEYAVAILEAREEIMNIVNEK